MVMEVTNNHINMEDARGTILYTHCSQRLLPASRGSYDVCTQDDNARSRHRTGRYVSLSNVPVSNIANQVLKLNFYSLCHVMLYIAKITC